jgi:hypothetical protein
VRPGAGGLVHAALQQTDRLLLPVREHSAAPCQPVLRIRIPDLGSRIPTPYLLELSEKFLGKKFYNSLKTGPNLFLQRLKNKIILNFVKFVSTKKGLTTNFFSPLSFVAVFWIRDPEWVKIRIRDPG